MHHGEPFVIFSNSGCSTTTECYKYTFISCLICLLWHAQSNPGTERRVTPILCFHKNQHESGPVDPLYLNIMKWTYNVHHSLIMIYNVLNSCTVVVKLWPIVHQYKANLYQIISYIVHTKVVNTTCWYQAGLYIISIACIIHLHWLHHTYGKKF